MKTLGDQLLKSLVETGARALPGRFILQFDFLTYEKPANAQIVALARENGLYLARQTNLWRGREKERAACGGSGPMSATACTDEQYRGLLEEGIHPAGGGTGPSAQGLYIEVFPYDAPAHKSAILDAHRELLRTAR